MILYGKLGTVMELNHYSAFIKKEVATSKLIHSQFKHAFTVSKLLLGWNLLIDLIKNSCPSLILSFYLFFLAFITVKEFSGSYWWNQDMVELHYNTILSSTFFFFFCHYFLVWNKKKLFKLRVFYSCACT